MGGWMSMSQRLTRWSATVSSRSKTRLGKGPGNPRFRLRSIGWKRFACLLKKGAIKFSQTNFPAVLLLHYGESCCSTYLFVHATFSTGPYISVALAVYAGTPNVQIITPVVPLNFHPSDTKARENGERFICALRRLLSDLKDYYLTDLFSESLLLQVKFPFYNTYVDGGASHNFVYEEQID